MPGLGLLDRMVRVLKLESLDRSPRTMARGIAAASLAGGSLFCFFLFSVQFLLYCTLGNLYLRCVDEIS
jgi:hypothetical protein